VANVAQTAHVEFISAMSSGCDMSPARSRVGGDGGGGSLLRIGEKLGVVSHSLKTIWKTTNGV